MTIKRFPKVSDTAQERRTHIIESAAQLIAKRGLESLSIRAVAKQAGCSRGLVEHYFRNKAELVIESNRWANETYLKRVTDIVNERQGLAALEAQLRNLLPYNEVILDEWRIRAVFIRQSSTNPEMADDNNVSLIRVYNEILTAMRHAQQQGEISALVPILEASEMILFITIGIATACLTDIKLRQPHPLDRRVAMMIGMLKSGNLTGLKVGDPNIEY